MTGLIVSPAPAPASGVRRRRNLKSDDSVAVEIRCM